MKTVRFIPLTFLCGAHGFAIFAPYLAMFLATLHLIRSRRRRLARVPVLVPVTRSPIASRSSVDTL